MNTDSTDMHRYILGNPRESVQPVGIRQALRHAAWATEDTVLKADSRAESDGEEEQLVAELELLGIRYLKNMPNGCNPL